MARVYVGTYKKYNEGSIFGAWLDLEDYSDKDAFYEAIEELHQEEFDLYDEIEPMFQDWEEIPEGMIGESWINEKVFDWLNLDDREREIIDAWADINGLDGYEFNYILERFAGTAQSPADFAEQTAIDCGSFPENIPAWICIDWEQSWKSGLSFDYDEVYRNGEYWFFNNY